PEKVSSQVVVVQADGHAQPLIRYRWVVYKRIVQRTPMSGLGNTRAKGIRLRNIRRIISDAIPSSGQDQVLSRFGLLIVAYKLNHVNLPGYTCSDSFVPDFPEDAVEFIQGINHFSDVRLLHFDNSRVIQRMHLIAIVDSVRIAVNPIDIVIMMHWMIWPIGNGVLTASAPSLKQHDAAIQAARLGSRHERSLPIEIRLIQF